MSKQSKKPPVSMRTHTLQWLICLVVVANITSCSFSTEAVYRNIVLPDGFEIVGLESTKDRSFMHGTNFFSFYCEEDDFSQIVRLNDLEIVEPFPDGMIREFRIMSDMIVQTGTDKWSGLDKFEQVYSNSVNNDPRENDRHLLIALFSKQRVYFALQTIK